MKNYNRPSPITEHFWFTETIPKVSIVCLTYNHAKFIRDTIHGFLIQETTFPVEIIIHDDASTDGTAEILREYQEKYPQIFRMVFQEINQYVLGCLNRNFFELLFMAKGEFIAYCEGDDFWKDPLKLEIQYQFLLKNPRFVATIHETRDVDEHGNIICDVSLPKWIASDSTTDDLKKTKRILPLRALMHRNVLDAYPQEMDHVKNGDNFLWILLGAHGECKFLTNIQPSCYRVHAGGMWQTLKKEVVDLELINTYFWIMKYFQRIGEIDNAEYYKDLILRRATNLCEPRELFELGFQKILGKSSEKTHRIRYIAKNVFKKFWQHRRLLFRKKQK